MINAYSKCTLILYVGATEVPHRATQDAANTTTLSPGVPAVDLGSEGKADQSQAGKAASTALGADYKKYMDDLAALAKQMPVMLQRVHEMSTRTATGAQTQEQAEVQEGGGRRSRRGRPVPQPHVAATHYDQERYSEMRKG